MQDQDQVDIDAENWFNEFLPKLRYKQDYSMCYGHSRSSEGRIEISRPYIRLFSTGITKIYRIQVLGETLEDIGYTEGEEKQLVSDIDEAEERHVKSKGEGWK